MKKKIVGVGFLLFKKEEDGWKIFTVKELNSKAEYFKKAGMISFPLETQKNIDQGHRGTVSRLVAEEIGIPWEYINFLGISDETFNLIPGRDDIETVYGFGILKKDFIERFNPSDDDISFAGWRRAEELLGVNGVAVRIETPLIIEHFLKKYAYKIK